MHDRAGPSDRPRSSVAAVAAVALLAAVALGVVWWVRSEGDASGAPRGLVVRDVTIDEPINGKTAAVRLVIDNATGTNDRLVGVSSDAAAVASIHRSTIDAQGRSAMVELAGIDVPAGEEVAFRPGGLHLMLEGLRSPMALGDTVGVTLRFERRGSVTVDARVVPIGEDGAGAADGGSGGHDMSDMDH